MKVNQLGNATDVTGELHPTHQSDEVEEGVETSAPTSSSTSSEQADSTKTSKPKSDPKPVRTTEQRSTK